MRLWVSRGFCPITSPRPDQIMKKWAGFSRIACSNINSVNNSIIWCLLLFRDVEDIGITFHHVIINYDIELSRGVKIISIIGWSVRSGASVDKAFVGCFTLLIHLMNGMNFFLFFFSGSSNNKIVQTANSSQLILQQKYTQTESLNLIDFEQNPRFVTEQWN